MQETVEQKIQSVRWYHRYEVLPGVWTPGQYPWDAKKTLDHLGVARDLHGLRVLDVGTWDGPLAFELEERGATVDAIDVQDPDCTAFNTAKSLRNSKVNYTQLSIYDINKCFKEKFDIITCFGVYYHLKHPLLAFEALAEALADGGRLYFEGEILLNYSETITGKRSTLDNRTLAQSDVPVAMCYNGFYKDASNWFVPNMTCLRGWLESAGLELGSYELRRENEEGPRPEQRITAIAKKAADPSIMPEIGIFEKNLELPGEWRRQFGKLKSRGDSGTNSTKSFRGLIKRALRRIFRSKVRSK